MPSGTVLIVEDQEIAAKDLSYSVENLGNDVLDIVVSGTVAVTKVAELKPDLVLMDVCLEGDRDGISAAEATNVYVPICCPSRTASKDTAGRDA